MFKHHRYCRVLPFVLLVSGSAVSAQTNQNDRMQRSEIVKVASFASPSVAAQVQASGSTVSTSPAASKIYAADILNADWKTQSSAFSCLLTHNIEGFGNAVFSRKTGSSEIFYLKPQAAVLFPKGSVSMDTLPPAWRSEQLPIHLGEVDAVAGDLPVKLSSGDFAPLLTQLLADAKVMFTASPSAGASQSSRGTSAVTRVVLDPKNFANAYKTYQQCTNVLVPYTFAQVSYLLLNYAEKSEGLSAASKTELSKVARYVKADPDVLGILIDAHSDNKGTADENEAISKQETEWVTAYLVLQGVDAEKIKARWHGDKFPIGNNKTEAGRNQNRRVTVRLENEATRKAVEEKAATQLAAAEKAAKKLAEQKAAKTKLAEQKPEEIAALDAAEKKAVQDVAHKPAEKPKQVVNSNTGAIKANDTDVGTLPSRGKITPEQISKMVDGLDLIPKH